MSSLFFHLFIHNGHYYAFNPASIRFFHLTQDEFNFLKMYQANPTIEIIARNLNWTNYRCSKIYQSLNRKKILTSALKIPNTIPTPKNLEILVNASQICNLKCQYCFVDQGKFSYTKQRVKKLAPAHVKRLIEVLPEGFPEMKTFNIHFYGGEPLLNLPALEMAVETAEKMQTTAKFVFSITTNGTIITDETIALLKRGHFFVILSIDGPSYIHDAARRTKDSQPTHALVLNFLKKVQAEPRLRVRGSSVTRKGWTLQQAETYLKSLNIDLIKAQIVRIPPDHPLALNRVEYKTYISNLRELANDVINSINQGIKPQDDRFNARVLQLLQGTRRISFCGAGKWMWGMAADGIILPCILLTGREEMALGHINDPVTEWVKNGTTWFENHGLRAECNNCWAAPLCGGGCPVMLQKCQDECDITRVNCECALTIYGAFYPNNIQKLFCLSNLPPEVLQ